jgi:hypothetical protein
VTIAGVPFDHLLFELVLSFSGWRWPMVTLSESFEALALGVQEALWQWLAGMFARCHAKAVRDIDLAAVRGHRHAEGVVADRDGGGLRIGRRIDHRHVVGEGFRDVGA